MTPALYPAILSTGRFTLNPGGNAFQQSSPTSATQRRQGQQTCFGWHGCHPAPIRPTQWLTRANGGGFLLSVFRPTDRLKWVRASARSCARRIARRDACPALPTGLVALLSAGIPPRHSDGIPQRAEQQWLFYPAFIAAPAVFRHGISFQTLPKNPDIYYTFL